MQGEDEQRILNEIGCLLAKDIEYPINGILLYAKLYENAVSAAIFKDLGDHVLYRRDDESDLWKVLLDFWESIDPDQRWAEMEYVVSDGRFAVNYTYSDEIDAEEDSFDRRDRAVARHFGNKPIVYPPRDDEGENGQVFEV